MEWYTVKEAQLVWAPIGSYTNAKGEERTKFLKLGVKVTMMDGAHWFFSHKHGSWTKHHLPVRKMDRLGRPAVEGGNPVFLPARKEKYTATEFQREWGRRKPELVAALVGAVDNAEGELS